MIISQTHEESGLEDALARVQLIEDEFEKALEDEADKEDLYKVKNAEEYLKASGTVDERKAQALINCRIEHRAFLKAEAVKQFLKAKMIDAQNAVSARQSLLTNKTKTNFGQSFNQMNA